VSYFAGDGANSFVVGDFNNDGKLDIASGSNAGIGILLGKGDGTFQTPTFFAPFSGQVILTAAADLNNDGNLDLVAFGSGILLRNGDGTFDALPMEPSISESLVTDINGDGKLDVVGSTGAGPSLGSG
jgi:hypothetical protein